MQTLLVSGATGMIGSHLIEHSLNNGIKVIGLTRRDSMDPSLKQHPNLTWKQWDASQPLHLDPKTSIDFVVHLAGESIAKRWSQETKNKILKSRVDSTHSLIRALSVLPNKPKHIVFASAVGFYGPKSSEIKTETSPSGDGFLADIVVQWEAAMKDCDFIPKNILRFGVVLSDKGGVLEKLYPLFNFGLGGPIGSGDQMMSWIHIDDLVRLITFYLQGSFNHEIVNAVSPEPASNARFAKAFANSLNRPSLVTTPACALKLVFGAMAEETVLTDQRISSERARKDGFSFQHPQIEEALDSLFKKT